MQFDYNKIANAILANKEKIIDSIDRYIEKADDDLKKRLQAEGYIDSEETVKAINDMQEEIAAIFALQTQDFIDVLDEAEKAKDNVQKFTERIKVFLSEDHIQDDVADITVSLYEDITLSFATSYIQEVEGDMVVNSIRDRTVNWFHSWSKALGNLMQISSHDEISNLIQNSMNDGESISDIANKILDGGWRNEYYQAKRVALTEVLRAHSVAREEAIQQSPATDKKEWRHTGSHKNNPRPNHVVMDGKIVPKSEPFELIGRDGVTYYPMYPRDSILPVAEVINCHCIHRGIASEDALGMSYEERKKLQEEFIVRDNAAWEKESDASNKEKAGIKVAENESSKVKYDYAETIINRKAIASASYRKRYSVLPETKKVQRKIASEAKAMLRHRSGTKHEDLVFVNSVTGESFAQTGYEKNENQVSPTRVMKKMLKKAEDYTIIAIHNHPSSSVPSLDDLFAAQTRKYKYGIVAGHDGTIYKYSVHSEINKPRASGGLDKLQRAKYIENEGEYTEALKKALYILKDSGVEMEVL